MRTTTAMEETRAIYGKAPIGFVATLGSLHEGHVALLSRARQECGTVVVSIYVNPLQFNDAKDFEEYPRHLERDLAIAREVGVDVVFAPGHSDMSARSAATVVSVPRLGRRMEGPHRPGHFDGVSTIVTKLLAGLRPDRAYFGKKDAQQLAIVRRLVGDLSLPVTIVPHATVREEDGLALSSRNALLSPDQREASLALVRGLRKAAGAAVEGERGARVLEKLAWTEMIATAGSEPVYAEMATTTDVAEVETLSEDSFLAVSAQVGPVRLIDNFEFRFEGQGVVVDSGILLDRPSKLCTEWENVDATGS